MIVLGAPVPAEVMTDAQAWLRSGVGCLFGRVHYGKDRFALAAVSSASELTEVRKMFGEALTRNGLLSCLVLVERENNELKRLPIADLVRYLDETYFNDQDDVVRRDVESVNGVSYSLSYTLRCPVTGVPVPFTDFDQVAFYPQAVNKDDPLYDPSMFAPVTCINITSDTYGFAKTSEDAHAHGSASARAFSAMSKKERGQVYDLATGQFQRLADRTIMRYGQATDPEVLEPIHVTDDGCHYIAQHDEAAFIETAKRSFRNEMPTLYVPRIIEQWEDYFEHGVTPDMSSIYAPSVPV
jgi:hypothetical protein